MYAICRPCCVISVLGGLVRTPAEIWAEVLRSILQQKTHIPDDICFSIAALNEDWAAVHAAFERASTRDSLARETLDDRIDASS